MQLITDTATIAAKIKCYGVDLSGNEKIFYMICNGTTPVTTAYTTMSIDGTLSGPFDICGTNAKLRHINWIQDVVSTRSSGVIRIRCFISNKDVTLIQLGHFYTINPVYLCPKGRRTIIKGINYIFCVAANDYQWIVYKPNDNGSHDITFPFRFQSSNAVTTRYKNTYQWSDSGLITIEEGEWCFLNREGTTAETSFVMIAMFCEFNIR
jgi:hypothetical protein